MRDLLDTLKNFIADKEFTITGHNVEDGKLTTIKLTGRELTEQVQGKKTGHTK